MARESELASLLLTVLLGLVDDVIDKSDNFLCVFEESTKKRADDETSVKETAMPEADQQSSSRSPMVYAQVYTYVDKR